MKKTVLLPLIALFCAAPLTHAQELPKIAVYVTGNIHENYKQALRTRIQASLISSKRFRAIERANSFLEKINEEQVKQRSGDIDDSQISQLGKQFGVKYICIADINPIYGAYQVSARIINVETAEVISMGESISPLKFVDDFKRASDEVVNNMLSGQAKPEPKTEQPPPEPKPDIGQTATAPKTLKPSFWIGLGVDAIGAGIIAYGVYENGKAEDLADDREFSKSKKATGIRNTAYIAGAAVLLSGISITIFF